MSLLSRLFGKSDPTATWVADPARRVDLDLCRNTVGDVRLGESIERLSFLGPGVTSTPAGGLSIRFPLKGVCVDCNPAHFITSFVVHLAEEPASSMCALDGLVIYAGNAAALTRDTSEAELTRLLGEPWWRDEDEGEVICFYEHGAVEWQMEMTNDRLCTIILGPPLLADPRQREAYGIRKPWPFGST